MFTSSTKTAFFGLVFAVILFLGVAISAAEPATITTVTRNPSVGSDGKSYFDYGDTESQEMLDAINRDHPVSTPF